jgi:hypothetical protein
MEELTVDNFPMALLGITLTEKQYEKTNTPPVPGKSIVVNGSGRLYLYMGDDHREGSTQIIVKEIGGYDMLFLTHESKKSVRLLNYKHV